MSRIPQKSVLKCLYFLNYLQFFLKKHAGEPAIPKAEPVEASESGDHLSVYAHSLSSKTSSSMKISNFNFFDPMTAAGIYDSTINSSTIGNNKTNIHQDQHPHHHTQHIYSSVNDYSSSSRPTTNGYWPYPTQPYFPTTPRPYNIINQMPSTSLSDPCSSPIQQDLSCHTYGSYPHIQKIVGNYPTSYEFYQPHPAKYC